MATKFQQRHYEAIAEVLQGALDWCETDEQREAVTITRNRLAIMFRYDNSLFDTGRFERACVPGANVKNRTR